MHNSQLSLFFSTKTFSPGRFYIVTNRTHSKMSAHEQPYSASCYSWPHDRNVLMCVILVIETSPDNILAGDKVVATVGPYKYSDWFKEQEAIVNNCRQLFKGNFRYQASEIVSPDVVENVVSEGSGVPKPVMGYFGYTAIYLQ